METAKMRKQQQYNNNYTIKLLCLGPESSLVGLWDITKGRPGDNSVF